MKTSSHGLTIIKHFEGLQLRAYQCSSGVWTIGYGHAFRVHPGAEITKEEAEHLLHIDVRDAEACIFANVNVPLTQNQFDALVSFIFNLGSGNFESSTLLKKLNTGDYAGAAEEFSRWINAGGKQNPGLIKRREAERVLFYLNNDSN